MSEQVLNFIPSNIFEDFANLRPTSTIAVVIFSSLVGVAYLGVARKEPEQAETFKQIIDACDCYAYRYTCFTDGAIWYLSSNDSHDSNV